MLTRVDVPSVGRCRKLAKILKGVKPAAWWIRCESGWVVDAALVAAPVGSDDYVPAYTLGQLFDWARRQGWSPQIWHGVLETERVCDGTGCCAHVYNWPHSDIDKTGAKASTASDALADAILAAAKEESDGV